MPVSDTKELELSHLDQQPHIRVYGRYYIIFPFPDISRAHAAKEALHTGFKAVLQRFPYLAGTVDIPDPSTERLRVRYPDPIDVEAEARRIFTVSYDDAQHDYDALAKDAFAQLPATIFCPNELKHHSGLGNDPYAERMTSLQMGAIPVFAAQATFIPGGLVLSAWFYHAVLDGTGNARIQKIWSDAVRALHPEKSKTSQAPRIPRIFRAPSYRDQLQPLQAVIKQWGHVPDPSSARGALAMLAQQVDAADEFAAMFGNSIAKRYEIRNGPDEGPNKVVTEMFRFSSPAINKLCNELSIKAKRHVSHFTALAAIIWGNVVYARSAQLAASGNTQSTLAVVVDLRKYLPHPFSSPDYLGNLVLSAMPTLSLESGVPNRVVSLHEQSHSHTPGGLPPAMTVAMDQQSLSLEDLATKITDSLHAVNATWAVTQINSVLTDPNGAQQNLLKFPKGPDLYITSWQRMGADREWCIPGTGSSSATAIRRAAWVSEGGIVILPRGEDKKGEEGEPYEVMISLTKADMERFEDGLKSAEWLVDSPAGLDSMDTVTLPANERHRGTDAKSPVGQARASL